MTKTKISPQGYFIKAMSDNPFIFERYAFDQKSSTLDLFYCFEGSAHFKEQIIFPPVSRPLSPADRAALDQAFRLLFLLAGVSYYKAYAPSQLKVEAFPLDKKTAAFVEKVYRNGLGEFSYKNNLDLSTRVHFTVDTVVAPEAVMLNLPHHACLPIGGGKDSIVTLECLRQQKVAFTLFALSSSTGVPEPITATAAVAGLPLIKVVRKLSENLFELNKNGAYNGHVPITAILSATALASSIMQGFDTIIMSNEHSASAPNLRYNNLEINHQYSKSLEFEEDFSTYVKAYITPVMAYFSFLRPLTECEVTRRFARLHKYHSVFRSCNTAFRQDEAQRNKNWCCQCPKCRFVFLALAPFIPKEELVTLFGQNLLNDPAQRGGFAELCGIGSHKPFECVGEVEESALLMEKLYLTSAWAKDAVVADLGPLLMKQKKDFNKKYRDLFEIKKDHRLPERYLKMLHACS